MLAVSFRTFARAMLVGVDYFLDMQDIPCGVDAHMLEIDVVIPSRWHAVHQGEIVFPSHEGWWAFFDQYGRPLIAQHSAQIFGIAERGHHGHHVGLFTRGVVLISRHPNFHWEPLGVVGSQEKRFLVHPFFSFKEAQCNSY